MILLFVPVLAFVAFTALAQPPEAADRLSAYLSGGVGEDERGAMLPLKEAFNLRLIFAVRRTGNYLAGVEVRIADTQGVELLRVESDGPFLGLGMEPER